MDIIEALNWRYATKKFDPTKKVTPEDLDKIKEVLRLSASSYGLQPLKYLIIENPDIREKLKVHSWGQSQVTDASHLIVFCSFVDIQDKHIDHHIENTAAIRSSDPEKLSGYGSFVKKKLAALEIEEKSNWNSKQAYIALGQLMLACALMGIDSTPMEGFEPEEYDKILGLTERNLHAVLVMPIGYRHPEDTAQFNKKVRKTTEDLFEII